VFVSCDYDRGLKVTETFDVVTRFFVHGYVNNSILDAFFFEGPICGVALHTGRF